MVKGKLERKYKLIYNGRELSKGLLSEAGKYDAMQILVQKFDEGREDAIDPDLDIFSLPYFDWSQRVLYSLIDLDESFLVLTQWWVCLD